MNHIFPQKRRNTNTQLHSQQMKDAREDHE